MTLPRYNAMPPLGGDEKAPATRQVQPKAASGHANREYKPITLPLEPDFDKIPPEPKAITAAPLRVSSASPDAILKRPMRQYEADQ